MKKIQMQDKFDDLMYQAGLTAQGSWDAMDQYDQLAIMKFAELIVRECVKILEEDDGATPNSELLFEHFGVAQ